VPLNRVLVVGDLIIDEFTYGEPIGISAETPTIVSRQTESFVLPGGAGCVVRHCQALGCKTCLCNTGKHDIFGGTLLNHVPAVVKRRFYCGSYKVAQFDVVPERMLTGTAVAPIIAKIDEFKPDVVIISDNARLDLDASGRLQIVKKGLPVLFDAQFSQTFPSYCGLDGQNVTIFMNDKEIGQFGHDLKRVRNEIGCGAVVWKKGNQGAMMLWHDGCLRRYEGIPAEVKDTCGAGDAFIGAFAALYGRVDRPGQVLELANEWAAASVETLGTRVPTHRPDLKEAIDAAAVR
jgi:bifunctional ADP-heptose synthase (sugar kinase/adenylyltransferase)